MFNPKAVRGYNRNYKRLQGPRAVKQVVRASHSKAGPRIAYQRLPRRTQRRYERKVQRQSHHEVRAHNERESAKRMLRATLRSAQWRRAMGNSPFKLPGTNAHNLFGSKGSVERADYAQHYQDLWQRVRKFYPSIPKGEIPKLIFEAHQPRDAHGQPTELAHVNTFGMPAGKRSVHVDPATTYEAMLRPSEHKRSKTTDAKLARAVPIHEWVHVFQGPWENRYPAYPGVNAKSRKSRRKFHAYQRAASRRAANVEGGAEAFTYLVGPDVGMGYRRSEGDQYDQYARRALRKKGRKWVLGGQFR